MAIQPKKRLLIIGALALVLILGGLLALYVCLPRVVETYLLPRLARELGLDTREARVRRVTFSGTELGPIRLEAGGRPAMAVETLRLEYSLGTLLSKKIQGIALEGLQIDGRINAQGLTLAGIALPRSARQQKAQAPALNLQTLLPIRLEHLAIRRAAFTLAWPDKQLIIPFEVEADTAALHQGRATARIRLTPRGSELVLEVHLDSAQNQWRVKVQKLSADLGHLAGVLAPFDDVRVKGLLSATGGGQGTLTPAEPDRFLLEAELNGIEIATPQGSLVNSAADHGPTPIHCHIQGQGLHRLSWSLAPFDMLTAARIRIETLGGDVSLQNRQWSVQAGAVAALKPQSIRLNADHALALETPVSMPMTFSAETTPDKGLRFEVRTPPRDRDQTPETGVALNLPQATWSGSPPRVHVQGNFAESKAAADYHLEILKNQISLPNQTRASAALAIQGRVTAADRVKNDMTIQLTDAHISMPERGLKIKEITCSTQAEQNDARKWALTGQVSLDGATLTDRRHQVIAKQITTRLPFAWPAPAAPQHGKLRVGAVQWKNNRMGSVQGSLHQQGRGLVFDLQHHSKLFSDMFVSLKGEANQDGVALTLRMPAYDIRQEVDLGRFSPAARGFRAQGGLEAEGRLKIRDGAAKATAWLKVRRGRLRNEDQKMVLEDIETQIEMDDLVNLHSRPGQTLSIGRLQLDRIQADSLAVDFQITSADALRIETLSMNWCRGKIGTQAAELSAKKKELDLTLDCQGVNMVMMLDQLGVAEGGGAVALSGRIPILWSDGRLRFNKGYLASPAGQTGTIQLRSLKGAQHLLDTLPPATPQRVQLDIAMEALKDYTYSSVDLRLESQADMLLLKLQLEGKPNQLLPFAYDQDLGQFKRVQGEGKADFKGIGIDLNLRSPFNEIINYQQLLSPKPR